MEELAIGDAAFVSLRASFDLPRKVDKMHRLNI